MYTRFLLTIAASAVVFGAVAPPPASHVRGTIRSVSGSVLTLSTASGLVRIALPPKCVVSRVVAVPRSEITSNAFVGITSVTGPGGIQRAVEVHVFPEKMRGAGEGSRPWDYPGAGHGSKMTNGTVAVSGLAHSRMTNGTVQRTTGNVITVRYKSPTGTGAQTIALPPNIPVVTFEPGTPADLKPGAHVFLMAAHTPSGMTASRIVVGTAGVPPPM